MRFSRKFPQLVSNQDMKPKGQTFWLLFNAFRLLDFFSARWPMSNGTRSRRKRWRREMTIKKRGWAGDGWPRRISKVWNLWESSNVESASEVPSAWQWGREWARSKSWRHGKMEDLDVTLGIQLHFQWRTTSKRKIYKMNQDESTWRRRQEWKTLNEANAASAQQVEDSQKVKLMWSWLFFRNQENHWRSICSWKMKISLLDSLQTSILLYLLLKSFEYVLDLFCGSPVKELSNQLAAMGSKLLQSFEMQSVLAQLQKTVTKLQIADISFPYCEELLAWRCWKLKRLWVYERLRWMLKQIALLPFVKLPAWLLRRSINEEERLDIRDSKKWQFTKSTKSQSPPDFSLCNTRLYDIF